jgi:hypothetical protein
MRLSSSGGVRVLFLLALAIGEIVGLLHFYRQQTFIPFVVLSMEGILLTLPLLWLTSLRRRGVPGFDIFIGVWSGICAIGLSQLALRTWDRGDKVDALACAGVSLFMAIVILLKLLHPRNSPVAKDAVTFFGYLVILAWAWVSNISTQWKIVVALPLAWFGWRLIFHIRNRQTTSKDSSASSDTLTDKGGRA